jgi:hypothetical protein
MSDELNPGVLAIKRWTPNAYLDGDPAKPVHGLGGPFKVSDGYPAGITWVAVVCPDGKLRPVEATRTLQA